MVDTARTRKLRWLCRRGMKELDVLLQRFVERESEALANGDWPELEAVLSLEDDRLWAGIQQPGAEKNPEFHDVMEAIRS